MRKTHCVCRGASQSFYTGVEEMQNDMPHPWWEGARNEEVAIAPGTVSQVPSEDDTENTRGMSETALKKDVLAT